MIVTSWFAVVLSHCVNCETQACVNVQYFLVVHLFLKNCHITSWLSTPVLVSFLFIVSSLSVLFWNLLPSAWPSLVCFISFVAFRYFSCVLPSIMFLFATSRQFYFNFSSLKWFTVLIFQLMLFLFIPRDFVWLVSTRFLLKVIFLFLPLEN